VKAGLRIDVDTHDGMTEGIPRLLDVLRSRGARATFYCAMGYDNSGRAVFGALFRRGFLSKMLRTRALAAYGLRTALSGTLLPARPIGHSRPDLLRRIIDEGHELGAHSWDHRRWQDRLDSMTAEEVRADLNRSVVALADATGRPATTVAAPAWLSRPESLAHEESLGLRFASDCRGRTPFYPSVGGRSLKLLQVPTTLPTLDELLGLECATVGDFFDRIARELDAAEGSAVARPAQDAFAVLTVHAELEGRAQAAEFDAFLAGTLGRHRWAPLGELADEWREKAPHCGMVRAKIAGRHGEVSTQGSEVQGSQA